MVECAGGIPRFFALVLSALVAEGVHMQSILALLWRQPSGLLIVVDMHLHHRLALHQLQPSG